MIKTEVVNKIEGLSNEELINFYGDMKRQAEQEKDFSHPVWGILDFTREEMMKRMGGK